MSLFMTTHAGEDCVNTYNRDLCFMLKLSFHLKVWEFLKLIITAVSSLLWCKSLSPRKSSGTWADTMSLCQVCWEFTAWKAQVQVSPKPSTPLKQPVAVLGACTSTGIDRHGCLAIPITAPKRLCHSGCLFWHICLSVLLPWQEPRHCQESKLAWAGEDVTSPKDTRSLSFRVSILPVPLPTALSPTHMVPRLVPEELWTRGRGEANRNRELEKWWPDEKAVKISFLKFWEEK